MIELSIIVPVYNTHKYLDKCLKSLVEQKEVKCRYEIIVVNDGSPDNSEEIILKYKEKYPKIIKYVKKENGGLSSARNEGLKHCQGKYIIFIDSDDYVNENLVSTFMYKNKNYDLFIYGYNEVYENDSKYVENHVEKDILMSNIIESDSAISLIVEDKAVRGYAWNKVFKRKIIMDNNIFFDETIKYIEDLPFVINYLSKCKNIYVSSSILYNYLQREGSLINSNFNINKLTAIEAYEKIAHTISLMNKKYLYTFYYFIFELNYELSVRIRISGDLEKYKKEYKILKKNMKKYYLKFIFKNVRFKYKLKATIKLLFYKIILMRY